MSKVIKAIGMPFVFIGNAIANVFTSRSKRIDYTLEFFEILNTFIKGNVDDTAIQVISSLSMTTGQIFSGADKVAAIVIPGVCDILDIMNVSDDAGTSVSDKLTAICTELKSQNNTNTSESVQTFVNGKLADKKISLIDAVEIYFKAKQQSQNKTTK